MTESPSNSVPCFLELENLAMFECLKKTMHFSDYVYFFTLLATSQSQLYCKPQTHAHYHDNLKVILMNVHHDIPYGIWHTS